jgi:hypothetical protein
VFLGRLEDLLPNIVVDWAARLRGGRCDFAHGPKIPQIIELDN